MTVRSPLSRRRSHPCTGVLHMKRSTIEDYARRAVLPSVKLGRHRRFIVSDVEATLRRLRDEGGEGWQ